MVTIISKIELKEAKVEYTDVGHTTDVSVINQINKDYDSSLGKFTAENRTKLENNEISISEFFNDVAFVYEARKQTDNIEGLGLIEVTNIDQL